MTTKIRHARVAAWFVWLAIAGITSFAWCGHAQAFVYKVLYSFKGGRDGGNPLGGLIVGTDGNLYGVTAFGATACDCGTIFKLTPKGKITTLYRFRGGYSGARPLGPLVRDNAGNLYGVTAWGGSTACGYTDGCGTIFRLSPESKHVVLHAFIGGVTDAWDPNGSLILDGAGNLYGTTARGGGTGCVNNWGCGTVYRLSTNRILTLLYAFQGGVDGSIPAGLLRNDLGDLYGTTFYGGPSGVCPDGCGTVFDLTAGGTKKVLHTFDETDGFSPDTPLARDAAGNLYGGTYSLSDATIYQVSPSGTFKTLFRFNLDNNGTFPTGEPLIDGQGNLFINNQYGGASDADCGQYGCGTLFELAADGTGSPRHEFGAWPQDGVGPGGDLVIANKKLYGVTRIGGLYNEGAVWVLAL